jgi:hypothetical protein
LSKDALAEVVGWQQASESQGLKFPADICSDSTKIERWLSGISVGHVNGRKEKERGRGVLNRTNTISVSYTSGSWRCSETVGVIHELVVERTGTCARR